MHNCQKHRNHHCIHAHKCTDPKHRESKKYENVNWKQNRLGNKSVKVDRKYYEGLEIIQDNEQCEFEYQGENNKNITNEYMNKVMLKLRSELQQSKRNQLNLQIENRKFKQKNLHIETQIQYLRSQLDVLVNNHNLDIKEEIKRHLKLYTDLNLKIKQITTELIDKEKKIDEVSTENYSLSKKNNRLENQLKRLTQKIGMISKINSELSVARSELDKKLKFTQKQLQLLKDKYGMLNNSKNLSSKTSQSEIRKLQNANDGLQKSLQKVQGQLNKQKQLHNFEKINWGTLIQDLKKSLNQKQSLVGSLKLKNKELSQKLEQVNDDLGHAKQLVIKYQNITQQTQKLRNQLLQSDNIQFHQKQEQYAQKTVPNIKQSSSEQQISSWQKKISLLQQQNMQLKLRIKQVETKLLNNDRNVFENRTSQFVNGQYQRRSVVINQELILSIGASSEFKKIIQQKNVLIRQLMREKTQLYNKIYEKQLTGN